MTHLLYNTATGQLADQPVGGHPVRRTTGDPATYNDGLDSPWIYIPDLPRPDYDPATQHAPVRTDPTPEGWGWEVVALTDEEIAARDAEAARAAVVANLGAAFKEQVPAEYQPQLVGLFANVRVLLDIGEPEMARAAILAAAIPAELEPLRAGFANLIPVPDA